MKKKQLGGDQYYLGFRLVNLGLLIVDAHACEGHDLLPPDAEIIPELTRISRLKRLTAYVSLKKFA